MSNKAKQYPEKKTGEPEELKEISEPSLVSYQAPNTIVVATGETHVGGKLMAYLNGKRVMEADVTHTGQNAYTLAEHLPANAVFDLQIGFFKVL